MPWINKANFIITPGNKQRDPLVQDRRDPQTEKDLLGRVIDYQGVNALRVLTQNLLLDHPKR